MCHTADKELNYSIIWQRYKHKQMWGKHCPADYDDHGMARYLLRRGNNFLFSVRLIVAHGK